MPPLVVDEDEAIAMVVALGLGEQRLRRHPRREASLSALSKVVQVLPDAAAAAGRGAARGHRRRAVLPGARGRRGVLADGRPGDPRPASGSGSATPRAAAARPAEDRRRHVEPHQLVTVGRRWYLLGYDLERHDWRSFRLDRLRDPEGTRAVFRPRDDPRRRRRGVRPAGLSAAASRSCG